MEMKALLLSLKRQMPLGEMYQEFPAASPVGDFVTSPSLFHLSFYYFVYFGQYHRIATNVDKFKQTLRGCVLFFPKFLVNVKSHWLRTACKTRNEIEIAGRV